MSIKVETTGIGLADGQYFKDRNNEVFYNVWFAKKPDGALDFNDAFGGTSTRTGENFVFDFNTKLDNTSRPPGFNPQGGTAVVPTKTRTQVTEGEPATENSIAVEQKQQAKVVSNNAGEQLQAAQQARVENANTTTPTPAEQTAVDNTAADNESPIDTG